MDIYVGESGRAEDFEISGDISDATKLKAENFPVCVSSSKVQYINVVVADKDKNG